MNAEMVAASIIGLMLEPEPAAQLLRTALDLWRGEVARGAGSAHEDFPAARSKPRLLLSDHALRVSRVVPIWSHVGPLGQGVRRPITVSPNIEHMGGYSKRWSTAPASRIDEFRVVRRSQPA